MTKKCNNCHETLPHSDFFKDKNATDGHYSICKPCKTKKTYEWREKNREKYNSDMRERNKQYKEIRRDRDLKKKYGSSLSEFKELLIKQNGCCWICQKTNSSTKRSFAMDHNHKTGKRRGILCYGCNRALHTLEKDGLLMRAFAYLEEFK